MERFLYVSMIKCKVWKNWNINALAFRRLNYHWKGCCDGERRREVTSSIQVASQYFTEFNLVCISAHLLCNSITEYFVSLCTVLLMLVKMAQSIWEKTRNMSECPLFGKCSDFREAELPIYESVIKCLFY